MSAKNGRLSQSAAQGTLAMSPARSDFAGREGKGSIPFFGNRRGGRMRILCAIHSPTAIGISQPQFVHETKWNKMMYKDISAMK
jgi:hypothetical protein